MAARAGKVVAGESPDLILLRPPDMQFLQDYVVFRVRERWPPLYRPAARLAQWLNDVAGGGPDGAPRVAGLALPCPQGANGAAGLESRRRCGSETRWMWCARRLTCCGRNEDLATHSLPDADTPAQHSSGRSAAARGGVRLRCRRVLL